VRDFGYTPGCGGLGCGGGGHHPKPDKTPAQVGDSKTKYKVRGFYWHTRAVSVIQRPSKCC
jgi:hypothetical protein